MASFAPSYWASFMDMFSYDFIFGDHHAAPYGMLVLCCLFLLSRIKKIKEEMSGSALGRDYVYIAAGLALIATAVILPEKADFVLLKFLAAFVGAFAVVFGSTARIPLILLAVFTVATMFPLLVSRYMEYGYAKFSIAPIKTLAPLFGLPLGVNGQLISFLTDTGQSITVKVSAGCAGPSTMGVFLGIFALMYLDMPLRFKRACAVFAFGVAGTWLQSIIRLLFILETGHYLGESALWTAHSWTIYALFPAWYLIFTLVYFKQAGGKNIIKKAINA
ncbi:MAG: exosortase/archaeosortase family protein [Bacillota bacterium]